MFSALAVGLAVFYGLGLAQLPLRAILIIAAVGSLAGSYWLWRALRQFAAPRHWPWAAGGLACFLTLMFFKIISDPLHDWDARSIWFFHGRMIYLNSSLTADAGWSDAAIRFSHPDYPKLLPFLAASIGTLFGFWNDFLPKLSLACLFVILFIGLCRFYENSVRFWCVAWLCLLTPEVLLWNGYMDGYLALAASLGLFYWCEYLESREGEDFLAGYLAFALAAQLKHEGAAIFVCSLLGLLLMRAGGLRKLTVRFWLPVLIGALPVFLWTALRQQWGLANNLLGLSMFERMAQRLQWDTVAILLQVLLSHTRLALLLCVFGGALFLLLRSYDHFRTSVGFVVVFITGYFAVLFTIYLSSGQDFIWHLATSAERTTLPIVMAGFVLLFRLWRPELLRAPFGRSTWACGAMVPHAAHRKS